jgi:hypothetical protein
MVMNAEAVRISQQRVELESEHHLVGLAAEEHHGHKQVVPHPQELEDREGGQRRERQRQDDAAENLEIVGAVDLRRLDEILGQAGDIAAQQIDGERQAEAGMCQPDAEIGFRQEAGRVVDLEQRDQRHLQWHDQQADDHRDDEAASRQLHPGERIGGERRNQDRDDGRRDGDGE